MSLAVTPLASRPTFHPRRCDTLKSAVRTLGPLGRTAVTAAGGPSFRGPCPAEHPAPGTSGRGRRRFTPGGPRLLRTGWLLVPVNSTRSTVMKVVSRAAGVRPGRPALPAREGRPGIASVTVDIAAALAALDPRRPLRSPPSPRRRRINPGISWWSSPAGIAEKVPDGPREASGARIEEFAAPGARPRYGLPGRHGKGPRSGLYDRRQSSPCSGFGRPRRPQVPGSTVSSRRSEATTRCSPPSSSAFTGA